MNEPWLVAARKRAKEFLDWFLGPKAGEIRRRQTPDLDWFTPPCALDDPAPWDRYWADQLRHGVAGFTDLFCNDGDLVDAMDANGLETVLCIGSGVSLEPHALARCGFRVTAMDLSPFAIRVAGQAKPTDEVLSRLVDSRPPRPGGSLDFVVGDLLDETCCPGPYDVVIERRTLQLFPKPQRATAMTSTANRLASRGIFSSHYHNGGWRPPEPQIHALESWFVGEGWESWQPDTPISGRVSWLFMSTG